jgi:hypothetical protein
MQKAPWGSAKLRFQFMESASEIMLSPLGIFCCPGRPKAIAMQKQPVPPANRQIRLTDRANFLKRGDPPAATTLQAETASNIRTSATTL